MYNDLNELVFILLDKNASISERDDAAMDLFEYDSDIALNALTEIAKSKNENPIILNSCGESIGAIWVKRNKFDINCFKQLSKAAQDGIYYVIKNDHPDWIKEVRSN